MALHCFWDDESRLIFANWRPIRAQQVDVYFLAWRTQARSSHIKLLRDNVDRLQKAIDNLSLKVSDADATLQNDVEQKRLLTIELSSRQLEKSVTAAEVIDSAIELNKAIETPLTEPFLIFQSLKSLSSIVESCLLKPINVNAAPEHGDILALLPHLTIQGATRQLGVTCAESDLLLLWINYHLTREFSLLALAPVLVMSATQPVSPNPNAMGRTTTPACFTASNLATPRQALNFGIDWCDGELLTAIISAVFPESLTQEFLTRWLDLSLGAANVILSSTDPATLGRARVRLVLDLLIPSLQRRLQANHEQREEEEMLISHVESLNTRVSTKAVVLLNYLSVDRIIQGSAPGIFSPKPMDIDLRFPERDRVYTKCPASKLPALQACPLLPPMPASLAQTLPPSLGIHPNLLEVSSRVSFIAGASIVVGGASSTSSSANYGARRQSMMQPIKLSSVRLGVTAGSTTTIPITLAAPSSLLPSTIPPNTIPWQSPYFDLVEFDRLALFNRIPTASTALIAHLSPQQCASASQNFATLCALTGWLNEWMGYLYSRGGAGDEGQAGMQKGSAKGTLLVTQLTMLHDYIRQCTSSLTVWLERLQQSSQLYQKCRQRMRLLALETLMCRGRGVPLRTPDRRRELALRQLLKLEPYHIQDLISALQGDSASGDDEEAIGDAQSNAEAELEPEQRYLVSTELAELGIVTKRFLPFLEELFQHYATYFPTLHTDMFRFDENHYWTMLQDFALFSTAFSPAHASVLFQQVVDLHTNSDSLTADDVIPDRGSPLQTIPVLDRRLLSAALFMALLIRLALAKYRSGRLAVAVRLLYLLREMSIREHVLYGLPNDVTSNPPSAGLLGMVLRSEEQDRLHEETEAGSNIKTRIRETPSSEAVPVTSDVEDSVVRSIDTGTGTGDSVQLLQELAKMDRQAMAHDATTQAVIEVSDEASEFLNNVNLHGNEDETMLEELRLPGTQAVVRLHSDALQLVFHHYTQLPLDSVTVDDDALVTDSPFVKTIPALSWIAFRAMVHQSDLEIHDNLDFLSDCNQLCVSDIDPPADEHELTLITGHAMESSKRSSPIALLDRSSSPQLTSPKSTSPVPYILSPSSKSRSPEPLSFVPSHVDLSQASTAEIAFTKSNNFTFSDEHLEWLSTFLLSGRSIYQLSDITILFSDFLLLLMALACIKYADPFTPSHEKFRQFLEIDFLANVPPKTPEADTS